jgi:hypothetical protein
MALSSIEQIKAQHSIETVVQQRGIRLVATTGGERLEGHCPFHRHDDTPSFNIYLAHCFGCGASGNVLDFVQRFDGCTFREALKRLSEHVQSLPTRLQRRVPRQAVSLSFPLSPTIVPAASPLLTQVQQHYHASLLAHPIVMRWLAWECGITEEGMRRCGIGFADGTALLQTSAVVRQEAQRMGILSAHGHERMRGRITCGEDGCSWMIGRSLSLYPDTPGYLGLSLSKPLPGYAHALGQIHPLRAIVVVEGALDYVIATQWDLLIVCVALLGTHASRRQLVMLLDLFRRTRVPDILSFDAEDAGRQASHDLLALLTAYCMPVRVISAINGARDPGELVHHAAGRSQFWRGIKAMLTSEERGTDV